METNRRQCSEEFKKETVEYSFSSEKPVKEVAQDLGIADSNLRRWRAQYRKRGELAFPGHGKENQHQYETRREAQRDLFEYIEAFYNRERLHSSLGYYSPEEYEMLMLEKVS